MKLRVVMMCLSSMVTMVLARGDEYTGELFDTTEVVVPPGEGYQSLFEDLFLLFVRKLCSEVELP